MDITNLAELGGLCFKKKNLFKAVYAIIHSFR